VLEQIALADDLQGRTEDAVALRSIAATLRPQSATQRRAWLAQLERSRDVDVPASARAAILRAASAPRETYEAARARLPRDFAGLADHLGADRVLALFRQRPPLTVADLRAAVQDGVDGDGPGRAAFARELAQDLDWEDVIRRIRSVQARVPLGRAWSTAELFLDAAAAHADVTRVQPAGSLRRYEPTVGDITLVALSDAPSSHLDALLSVADVSQVRYRGPHEATFLFEREEITIFVATPDEHAGALLHYTGSAAHVAQLRGDAADRDLRLTARGLFTADGRRVPCATEADVYAALDLPDMPAEIRHGRDEITLARRGLLPRTLVQLEDILGDLHMHTLWSDGRDTGEAMVRSARALGYRYVAITDHSPSAQTTRTVNDVRLCQQQREIDQLRRRFADIEILHGLEVDILADGRLDLPDAVLDPLDIVLASLHQSHGQSGAELTRRYLAAIAHPLVNVITHPANRTPGQSEGYDLDYDALFRAAVATGTALEIDGAPGHLDMDGFIARRAVDSGVTVVIDSDCHMSGRLGRQMRLGIGTARRGLVEPRHVLNSRPVDDIRAFVARKRARAGVRPA